METKKFSWKRRSFHGNKEVFMETKKFSWKRRSLHGNEEVFIETKKFSCKLAASPQTPKVSVILSLGTYLSSIKLGLKENSQLDRLKVLIKLEAFKESAQANSTSLHCPFNIQSESLHTHRIELLQRYLSGICAHMFGIYTLTRHLLIQVIQLYPPQTLGEIQIIFGTLVYSNQK